MKKIFVVLFLLISTDCLAIEKRVTVDDSGFPEKWRFIWAIENIIQTNDNDVYHKVKYEKGDVIVDVPENMDIDKLITEQKITDEIASEQARTALAKTAQEQKEAEAKEAVKVKLNMTDAQFNELVEVIKLEVRE